MPTTYAHTNLVATDWKRLSSLYQEVFGCVPIPPQTTTRLLAAEAGHYAIE
jgi:predicted enzyme related to lactoylglutathione lyase